MSRLKQLIEVYYQKLDEAIKSDAAGRPHWAERLRIIEEYRHSVKNLIQPIKAEMGV